MSELFFPARVRLGFVKGCSIFVFVATYAVRYWWSLLFFCYCMLFLPAAEYYFHAVICRLPLEFAVYCCKNAVFLLHYVVCCFPAIISCFATGVSYFHTAKCCLVAIYEHSVLSTNSYCYGFEY